MADEYKMLTDFLDNLFLLTSSSTFDMGSGAMKHGASGGQLLGWMGATLVLGVAFLGMELHDFATMFGDGAYPTRSGIDPLLVDYNSVDGVGQRGSFLQSAGTDGVKAIGIQ